ncbi:MAG: DUF3499 family protein [Microthrixaceae bacterium]|nr:DUF3499 family protein [Microthrixaceae bacterium]
MNRSSSSSVGKATGGTGRSVSPRSTQRVCARPYCSKAAAATLSYAYDTGSVWLDDLTADSHPMVHDLCGLHADAVSVPKGWRLVDRRSESEATVSHLAAG